MPEAGESSSVQFSPNVTAIDNEEDASSLISNDTQQQGVKRIEAISQTWTHSSLVAAYLGYVSLFLMHVQYRIQTIFASFELKPGAKDTTESFLAEHKRPTEFFYLLAAHPWKCKRQVTSLFTPRAPLLSIPWSPPCWSFRGSSMVRLGRTCGSPSC